MEVDEHSGANDEIVQVPQETCSKFVQMPKVCDEFQAHQSIGVVSCTRKMRRRKFLSPLSRRERRLHNLPERFHMLEHIKSSEKTHISRFQKREITTIQEEVFQFKKHPHSTFVGVKSKSKDYKEKVASLKNFIEKLKLNNLETSQTLKLRNPNSFQSNIPDETIQLFEKIHL